MYDKELQLAIQAVRNGFSLAFAAQSGLTKSDTAIKTDASFVTAVDFAVQAIVNHMLLEGFDYPIMAEENANRLLHDLPLLERVQEMAIPYCGELSTYGTLTDTVDSGKHLGGTGTFWVLDPIDGTRGFLAGHSWTVSLALVDDGIPVVGVLACAGVPGGDILLYATPSGAVREIIGGRSAPAEVSPGCEYAICESYEGPAARRAEARLSAIFPDNPALRLGGGGKYACVATGLAGVYARLSRQRGRLQCAWDHAAGAAVVSGAGGTVTDATGMPLDFSTGRSLSGDGILATNGFVHERALKALKGWLG